MMWVSSGKQPASSCERLARPARNVYQKRSSLYGALGLVSILLSLVACISERSTGTTIDAAACALELPSTAFGSSVVIIRDFTFIPAQVRIRAGTKVTWVNCGAPGTDSHTSTSDAGVWNSPLMVPGATFTREFATAGAFPYHCEPHPSMKGSVIVE